MGKRSLWWKPTADTGYDIVLLEARSGRVRPFLNSQFDEKYPEFSPDGRWIAYSSDESKRNEVYVQPFPGPGMKHQVSSQGGIQPLWARNGKQLFYRWQDQVWAVDVRTDGGFATGKPRLLFERPGYGSAVPIRGYDLSHGWTAIPHGQARTKEAHACHRNDPIWTPDGKRIVLSWQKSTVPNLFSQPYDGSSPMERLTTSEYAQYPESWFSSSDGQTLALAEYHADTGYDILMLETRSGRVRPFLNSQFNEMYPEFSPDGRWIAYSSNESKRDEVYVASFPMPGMKHQVSSQGGEEPLWARNGKQLFYRWKDQVWVVDVRTDGGFSTGKPRLLFERPGYSGGITIRAYDLSQDGQRFLMVKREQRKPTPVTEMILVLNWFEELKQKLPTGNK